MLLIFACTKQEEQSVTIDTKEEESSKGIIVQAEPSQTFEAIRFKSNPIIYPDMPGLKGEAGKNINGPSLIHVPEWVKKPLGRYYLYFAHHSGKYIRLAYADKLEGPWTVHEPGTLHMKDAPGSDHIASPDVHVDHEKKEIRMYFHQPGPEGSEFKKQVSYVATSKDGLSFKANKETLGKPYFRVFKYNGYYYVVVSNYADLKGNSHNMKPPEYLTAAVHADDSGGFIL